MVAEVISVGTELLLGDTVDTNAASLGQALARAGIDCHHRQTVGDNLGRLTAAVQFALQRADLVILIGGLGPTEDDLTRDAVAAALGVPLVEDMGVLAHLRALFERRGLRWVDSNRRQAGVPRGGRAILNDYGTAPGIVWEGADKKVVLLPGPPREFRPMVEGWLERSLRDWGGGNALHRRVLRVVGLGESRIEEALADLVRSEDPTLASYAKTDEVHLRLMSRDPEKLAPVAAEIRARLGWHVYGEGEESLESLVIRRLAEQGSTLSVAESATGGLLGARLTSPSGASNAFLGGIVAYTEEVKARELGVRREDLARHSAVSEAVAAQMARGACERFGSTYALSITGVAGPGPDSRGNPEGLVFVGLARQRGSQLQASVERHVLGNGRELIRARAAQVALAMVHQAIVT